MDQAGLVTMYGNSELRVKNVKEGNCARRVDRRLGHVSLRQAKRFNEAPSNLLRPVRPPGRRTADQISAIDALGTTQILHKRRNCQSVPPSSGNGTGRSARAVGVDQVAEAARARVVW